MATRKKTDDVLAAARKELRAQLAVVRAEKTRLDGDERALTQALASMDGTNGARASATSSASAGAGRSSAVKQSTRKSSMRKARRSRRRPGASKSTTDRVKELEGLLADGAKSRTDLAAALKVSPARVQQLLRELGGSVSSQAAPGRREKLWSLKASSGNGASAAKATSKPAKARAKRTSTRKPAAAKVTAAK